MKYNKFKNFQGVAEYIYQISTPKTIVYLSGGSTPKPLYELFAQEKFFHPAGVGMVDERYGPKWHEKSNELMIKQTGLLAYLKQAQIPFYPMLQTLSPEEAADAYDQQLRALHAQTPRHIALLGIGADGHIAGMVPQNSEVNSKHAELFNSLDLVVSYTDEKMGERITQTFLALSLMDEIIVLVLGEEKEKALEAMQVDGSEEEIPARFLMRDTISPKVTIITDQTV